jgi:hypothetical protein
MNVLKKAGIVVAGSAAALLALSPLAFAGEGHERHHHPSGPAANQVNYVGGHSSHSTGLVAIGDVNALNNVNVCPSVTSGIGLGDVLGIFSPGRAGVPVAGGDAVCVNDNSVHQKNSAH